jgi:hypothetical protein
VLEDPCRQSVELHPQLSPGGVVCVNRHRDVPLDRTGDALERQAALVVGLGLAPPPYDGRVDERDGLLLGARDQDEHTPEHPHLVGGEADPARVGHQSLHACHQASQILIEAIDLAGGEAQDGVAVLPDLGERGTPPGLLLGALSLLSNLPFDLSHRGWSLAAAGLATGCPGHGLGAIQTAKEGVMERDLWTYSEETVGDVDVTGFGVEATDGGIGKVDEATYEVGSSYIVVDTGPWIFGRKVVLPAGVIDRIDVEDETVYVSRTKDEIKNAPEYDIDRGFDDTFRGDLGTYYGERSGVKTRRGDPLT